MQVSLSSLRITVWGREIAGLKESMPFSFWPPGGRVVTVLLSSMWELIILKMGATGYQTGGKSETKKNMQRIGSVLYYLCIRLVNALSVLIPQWFSQIVDLHLEKFP